MAQRSHVPKFGNWESEENVPYTAYFDKARKGRTEGKMINPNDPQENPDLVSDYGSPAQAPPSGARAQPDLTGQGAVRRAHERRRSREDGDLRQYSESPGRHDNLTRRAGNDLAPRKSREDGDLRQYSESPARHDNLNRRASNDLAPQRYGGHGVSSGENHNKRPGRQGGGSENSMERSPLHPHAKISGRGSSHPSPAWEGKSPHSYDSSHGTPGRSRLKPKGNESPDKGAAVPKFGDWDENNPAAADGYTHIFNQVREEKQIGAGRIPGKPTESSHSNARKQTPGNSSKSCCFPWGRK